MKGVTPCWVKNGSDSYQLEKGRVLKNETGTCRFTANGSGTSKIATCSGILHPSSDVVLLACGYATTYAENVECSVKKNAMLSTCWCSHYDFCNKAVPSMLKIRGKGRSLSAQKIGTKRQSSTLEISDSTTAIVHLASNSTNLSSTEYMPQLFGTVIYKNLVSPTTEDHLSSENELMSSPTTSLFGDDLNSTIEKLMNTTTMEDVVETNITALAENTTKSNAAQSLRREIFTIFSLIFVLLKVFG
uniref:Uncharacterized protein n=1 Tax=Romanomermis culicivorax TaxID=13658 RepID=A0A915K3U3_ROMCU